MKVEPWETSPMKESLPGTVLFGQAVSYFMIIVPTTVFILQSIYSQYAFRKSEHPISKFYSTLISLNILAMAYVTTGEIDSAECY